MFRCTLVFLVTTCVFSGIGSSVALGGAAEDEAITKQVMALFAQHADFGNQLTVHTKKGVVHINGFVANSLAKENADSLAKSVDGVKEVLDNAGIQK